MTAEIIEGEVRELPAERALVAAQPGQALVATASDPAAMVAVATRLADVLADIVERKRLYANISGKRYPTVEAWATIARLDNVVAREGRPAVRNDDGSWEAFAELIRLSDGMVIGSSSALCGDPGDRPWNTRADYQKRSMAQTRATSRAFRQQYSWIMALAGYEPTPAEEMPRESEPDPAADGLIGIAEKTTKMTGDYLLRQTPEGSFLGFRLKEGRGGLLLEALGPLADALALVEDAVIGKRVQVWGHFVSHDLRNGGSYKALRLERIQTPELTLPDPAVLPDSGGAESGAEPPQSQGSDRDTPVQEAQGQPPEAEAEPAGETGVEPAATPVEAAEVPASALCGSPSPYGDDESCDLLQGHKGVHKRVSAPIPTSWGAR